MRSPHLITPLLSKITFLPLLACALGFGSNPSYGQMGMTPASQTQAAAPQDTQAQITQLRAQVAQLQAALQQGQQTKKPASGNAMPARPGMGMPMGDSGEMGGMSGGAAKPPMARMNGDGGGMAPSSAGMKPNSAKPMGGMGMGGMGMGGMGMGGMSMGKPMPMPMPMSKSGGSGMSAKPGPPMGPMNQKPMAAANSTEPSPLLHIGAKDFFLDHATHLMLSADQRASLESIKTTASQQKAASQKQVDQAEQELWQLTSADQPDGGQIDKKVQQIATLNANEQIAFINSVAASSSVLTPDQRAQIVMPMSPAKGMKSKMQKKPMTAPMKM